MSHQIIHLLTSIGVTSIIFIILVISVYAFISDEPFDPTNDYIDF